MAEIKLSDRIAADGITLTLAHVADEEREEDYPGGTHYRATLRRRVGGKRRSISTPFSVGSAWTEEPTAADVLSSLLLDSSGVTQTADFEEWAADYGYDADSRKAEAVYRACCKVYERLTRFLGDEFEAYMYETSE
jgi:hypothetical protein